MASKLLKGTDKRDQPLAPASVFWHEESCRNAKLFADLNLSDLCDDVESELWVAGQGD